MRVEKKGRQAVADPSEVSQHVRPPSTLGSEGQSGRMTVSKHSWTIQCPTKGQPSKTRHRNNKREKTVRLPMLLEGGEEEMAEMMVLVLYEVQAYHCSRFHLEVA